jgi:C1A family cysteine protease
MGNNNTKQFYGWKKDLYDSRDLIKEYNITEADKKVIKVDLSNKCPKVYDQGNLNSSVANSISTLYEYEQLNRYDDHIFTPSRLFIYYNTRLIEGTVDYDDGITIRNVIKSMNLNGICPEVMWKYITDNYKIRPPEECYLESWHHHIRYKRLIQQLDQLKKSLILGKPFIFGMKVYTNFNNIKEDGILTMPNKYDKLIGYHSVVAIGYNDNRRQFLIRNSYSDTWGKDGNFLMPYDYILNEDYCNDFWIIYVK